MLRTSNGMRIAPFSGVITERYADPGALLQNGGNSSTAQPIVSGALDARTRTMLAEAELDNRDGAFLSGSFVQVSLQLPDAAKRLDIPSEARRTHRAEPQPQLHKEGDRVQVAEGKP